MQFHHFQRFEAALEASLTALKRNGEDLLEDSEVAQPVLLLIMDIRLVIGVDLAILPLLLVPIAVFLQKPGHLTEIELFEPPSLLLDRTAQVADLRQDLGQFRQHDHVFHHEPVGLDEEVGSFEGAGERRDEKDVNFSAFLNVGRGKVGTLGLKVSFLAERAVYESDVVMQVSPEGLLKKGVGQMDVFVELGLSVAHHQSLGKGSLSESAHEFWGELPEEKRKGVLLGVIHEIMN